MHMDDSVQLIDLLAGEGGVFLVVVVSLRIF